MSITINFKFEPRQHVLVTAYGLDCRGRIQRLIYTLAGVQYEVEYAIDSQIKVGPFYEDELEKV